jgi:hypothetical protein
VKTRKDSTLTRATDVIMENEGWRPIWMDVKPIDNEALILKDTEKHVDIPLQSVQFVAYVFCEACRIRDYLKQLVMINCSSV